MICRLLFFIYFFPLCQCGGISAETSLDDPDINRNVNELIASKGYPVVNHTVQTDDGYLLSVQRIPHGRNGNSEEKDKDAVLLIHGVLGDATNWVINFPHQSLGFILADKGYDVWLLNTRGCTYSRKHVRYNTDQYQFWDFSFDEIGQYDAPATIDYILDATGRETLFIVAHSQGTSGTFAMLSSKPNYNDKIKLFIALSPVAKLKYTTTVARVLVPFADLIASKVNIFTAGEFLPNTQPTRGIQTTFCGVIAPEACEGVLYLAGGLARAQLNETRLAVYFAHFPSGSSTKSIVHYSQLVKSGKFRKYDYGILQNLKYYRQLEPPDYEISRITTPVALMWSANDKFTHPKDVEYLQRNIKSLVFDYQVPYPYGHFDFVQALNAAEVIYKHVLELLSEF